MRQHDDLQDEDEDFINTVAMGIKTWLKENTPHKIKSWQNGPNQWSVVIETKIPDWALNDDRILVVVDGTRLGFLLQFGCDEIITINNIGNRGPVLSYEDPNLNEQILEFINNPAKNRSMIEDGEVRSSGELHKRLQDGKEMVCKIPVSNFPVNSVLRTVKFKEKYG